jgi:peptide deformylase
MGKVSLKDHSVQLSEAEYNDVLTRPSCKVNLSLMQTSRDYRTMIYGIKAVMINAFHKKYSDYEPLHGISGPNIGIPLQILGFKTKDKTGKLIEGMPKAFEDNPESVPDIMFMLNPVVLAESFSTYTAESNCGALLLYKPIKVKRYSWVNVEYTNFDLETTFHIFGKPVAATIQHEIDHLNGLTILDRQVKTDEVRKS